METSSLSLPRRKFPEFSVKHFEFDGHQVLELNIVPSKEAIEESISSPREIILVVDKSGSMGWRNEDGSRAYELVQAAIEKLISIISDLDIYLNIVFFDDEVKHGVMFSSGTAAS